jgi:hypothetical protein
MTGARGRGGAQAKELRGRIEDLGAAIFTVKKLS